MKYENVDLTEDQAKEIRDQKGWEHIAETRQSDMYWNENTGELLRIPNGSFDDDTQITLQKLIIS